MRWISRAVGTALVFTAALGACGLVGDGPSKRDYAELVALCGAGTAEHQLVADREVYIRRAARAGDPAEVSGEIVLKRAEPGEKDRVSPGGWTWSARGIDVRAGGVSDIYLRDRRGYDSYATVVDVTDDPAQACTRLERLARTSTQ